MHQYYSLISVFFVIELGQRNNVYANQINLKQSYCRDLRDCQTYFPCAVFSSGFSYSHVIKRCSNKQIFDEKKQKCVKNTMMDPMCSKQKGGSKQSRIRTTKRPLNIKETNDNINDNDNNERQSKIQMPLHLPPSPPLPTVSTRFLKRKNLDFNQIPKQENPTSSKLQRVCYVTNWSRFRTGEAKFEIEYIDPFMCTHIIYAYATVDSSKPEIVPIQKDDTEQYRELGLLKKRNPDLKLSIRIGGKSGHFTRYFKRSKTAAQVVRSLIWFVSTYGFDGVDIAFDFPDDDVPEDRLALTKFLEEIAKQKRSTSRWIVTLTAAPYIDQLLKAYDIPQIEKLINYVNLMTFDIYGPWDERTGIFAPLHQQPYQTGSESLRNVDGLVKLWLSLGVPREKILIGIPTYGRSYTLASGQKGLHAPVSGVGYPGRYTKTGGFLAYYEVCEHYQSNSWQKIWLDAEKAWYMTSGDQWITFEDVDSATQKASYARGEQLAGVFIWSIDTDEFSGFFCNTQPFPITRQVFATLNLPVPVTTAPAIAIQARLPNSAFQTPPVHFVNVQSQSSSVNLPANLQKLMNALSVLPSSLHDRHQIETTLPPPIAHQTYNAEYVCGRPGLGRNGIHRDRTNCTIFYYCEGDDLKSLRYHIFFCPPGLEFSMNGCTCDWATGQSCQTGGDTFCGNHYTTTTTTTTMAPYIPQSSMNVLNNIGQLLGISNGRTLTFDCSNRRSGLYRDMYDCTKFYFCTTNDQTYDGSLLRYDFICPTNYVFSMTTCRCELGQIHTCRTLVKTDCLLL